MDITEISGSALLGLGKHNVILGKNGCGKSFLLKRLGPIAKHRPVFGAVRYVTPERGGLLQFQGSVEHELMRRPQWIDEQRLANQTPGFREQSAALFRRLEYLTWREIEREQFRPGYIPRTFDATVDLLNRLLDRVCIERDDRLRFKILLRDGGGEAQPHEMSSGECELISLGIEFLAFLKECDPAKDNLFLVDEPDVHLHPDLQDRLADFIIQSFREARITLILATHSTALLAALAARDETRVAFMRRNDNVLTFKPVSDIDRTILPMFGAHPLSNVFNQSPALLIEGEDDERIWQQAVRSSGGRIRVYPCVVEGISRFREFEVEVNNIIEAVYDEAKAYSLRDRDLDPEAIDSVGHLVRMRLSCRSAENLMLADDVLASAGTDWTTLQTKVVDWATSNQSHQYRADVQAFIEGGFDRKGHDLKTIRNILVGLMSNKPWEVLVGQAIAHLAVAGSPAADGSLRDYLGQKVCTHLLRLA